jgi:hypothetical protein
MILEKLKPPCSALLSFLLAASLLPPAQAQEPKLNIVIVEGEGAINNVRQRVAREPIVQVEDENRKPIAGAVVVFMLPNQGAGGAFADGSRMLTVTTDSQGRAVARGFKPNNVEGKYQIRVNASSAGMTGSTVINQTNAVVAGAAAAGSSSALKWLLILGGIGAGAGIGAYVATRDSGGGTPTTPPRPAIVITPGTPTVGGPR